MARRPTKDVKITTDIVTQLQRFICRYSDIYIPALLTDL